MQADLLEQLEANSDATHEQHCQMWEARIGTRVSEVTFDGRHRDRKLLGNLTLTGSSIDSSQHTEPQILRRSLHV